MPNTKTIDALKAADPKLNLYVIYDHPSDYPDCFVIRRWELDEPKEIVAFTNKIEVARQLLKDTVGAGLVNLGKYNTDDPAIAEVWV